MELNDVTFEDILKNGPEWGNELLRSFIGRELKNHDKRLRALATIRIWEHKKSKIPDLLKLLEYNKTKEE